MPYISTTEAAKIRETLRREFPEFSFRCYIENHSSLYIVVKSGYIDFFNDEKDKGYLQVNQYHLNQSFKEGTEQHEFLSKVKAIANRTNGTEVIDGDYGRVPHYYVNIRIGDWDKPYILTNKKIKMETTNTTTANTTGNAAISINTEKNGIEIKFPSKPSAATLTSLLS